MSDCTNDFENNIPDTEKTVPAENHQEQQEYQLQHQENEAAYLEPGTSNSAVPTSPAAPANPAPAHAAGPTPPAEVEPTPASSDAAPEAAASEGAINSPDSKTKKPAAHRPRYTLVILGSVVGATIGALLVVLSLKFAGILDVPLLPNFSSAGKTITINAGNTKADVAQAVAKKCLPSVASLNVTAANGRYVGSGVLLDKQGHILTNYHVVARAQSISVTLGKKRYEAKVVGSDPSSDLAVIKIKAQEKDLTPMEIADSSSLVVGDWVMSIGSPYGLDQSVSSGIVSSLYRSTMLPSAAGNTIYANLIQTDAAINPGNSGGALVNAQGKLVGINSIIESKSGANAGIGFAIPSNYAVRVAQTIISGKPVLHAYIGLALQTVTPENSAHSQLAVNQGAYVAKVTPGSPADKAGIKQGDVITKINDEAISSADALILAIRSREVGDKIKVTVQRGDAEKTVEVTLGSDEVLQKAQSTGKPSDQIPDQSDDMPRRR